MKKVSVIMPVYNVESYLKKSIESILRQTYENIELILIDDGSTDRSGEIIDEFVKRDKRIRVIHQDNFGVSVARNIGLQLANGHFITFVDSDDTLDRNGLKVLMEIMQKNDTDIISCNTTRVTFDKKEVMNNEVDIKLNNNNDIITYFLQNKAGSSACAKIYKAEILKDIRFNPLIRINEDKLFIYYAFKKTRRYIHTNLSLYHYYQRHTSASHSTFSRRFLGIEKVANIILDDVKRNYVDLIGIANTQFIRSLVEVYRLIAVSKEARREFNDDYRRLRNKILNNGHIKLDNKIGNFQLWLIRYSPSLYIAIVYAYDKSVRWRSYS